MSGRPTEPGWYWLSDAMGEDWEIVRVYHDGYEGHYARVDFDCVSRIESAADERWGGKITQEPVVGEKPPF